MRRGSQYPSALIECDGGQIAASENHSSPREHNFELLFEFSVEMRVVTHNRSNLLGILSVAFSACFLVYAFWNVGPNAFTSSPLDVLVLLAVLLAAAIAGIAAARTGSKWWLLALIVPFLALTGMLAQWLMH